MSYFCSCSKYVSAVETAPQLTSREFVLARTNCTLAGACGRSGGGGEQNFQYYLITSCCLQQHSCYNTPTCFQVPQIFTTDLVVPSFTITVTATPYIKPGIDSHSTVTSTGPGDVVFKSIHQHCFPTHGV